MLGDRLHRVQRRPAWLPVAVALLLIGWAMRADGGLGLPLPSNEPVDEQALRAIGVEPDAAGIADFLGQMYEDHAEGGPIDRLLAALDAPDYRQRKRAEARLASTPLVSNAALKRVAETHGSPEVRMRARRALAQRRSNHGRPPLLTVLRYAAAERVQGVAPATIRLLSRVEAPSVWARAFYAVQAAARADERAAYRQLPESDQPAVRSLALLADWLTDEANGVARAAEALDAEAPTVRLAAGWAMLNAGDRRGLAPLADLLDHPQPPLRRVAIQALRTATGQRLGYAALVKPDEQTELIDRWRQWVKTDGRTAKLKPPRMNQGASRAFNRTLIARFQRGQVVEFDNAGKMIWQQQVNRPYGVQGLPNGHRLVGSFDDKAVYEYDGDGKRVWQKAGLPGGAMSVQRLQNGNTLIACSDGNRVLEVDENGSVVWQAAIDGRPVEAQRLDNKRTLVALQEQRVVEVDPAGQVVWSIDRLGNVQSAVRLPNGQTLVTLADAGKVVAYDRSGSPVRTIEDLQTPLDAALTDGGGIAVIEQRRGLTVIPPGGSRELRIDLEDNNPILGRFDEF